MKSILSDIGEVIWGADSRLVRTLRDYINPGIYTRNWLDKKQARYISPVRMFLIINLVYFLFLSFLYQYGLSFDTFVTPFESQFHNQLYSDLIRDVSLTLISSNGFEIEQFEEIYNNRVFAISNTMIIILSLLAAVILFLLNFRKSSLFYHHLTMGLYYGGFLLLLFLVYNILLIPVVFVTDYLNIFPTWFFANDLYSSSILLLFIWLFSFFSQLQMYYEHKFTSFLKSFTISILFGFVAVIFYRFILFWITMSSVLLFS